MAKKKETAAAAPTTLPTPRLKKVISEKVAPKMMEQFKYRSTMEVPRLEKIVVNMGVGEAAKEDKALDNAIRDMAIITGQKPVVTMSRKAVSNFKLRENMKIGCKVTLRGDRALHFLDRLNTVVLPRIRDFQGLNPNSFDGRGNYAFGLKEQLVFPEIPYDTFDRIRGMDVIVCTTAKNDEEARFFLKEVGMPLREK